ncbi:DUF3618 domain-containing protein [Rathayibacter sp. YIM 133350]|uniref:DUF3618 domain-containing protein n=1 Tax=Rathayibacter sp. YIM 133350 TaxID=3131992 RepID=UPI00307D02EE
MTEKSRAELRADVLRARSEIATTFDAIEDKLNVPRQLQLATGRARTRIQIAARENPALLGGVAATAAAVVGLAVWAIVRGIIRD